MSLPPLTTFQHPVPPEVGGIFAHIGGRYTIGAPRLCGSPQGAMKYRCRESAGVGSSLISYYDAERSQVAYEIGLEFPVSGKTGGELWLVTVAMEPNGEFSVWLTSNEGVLRVKRCHTKQSLRDGIVAMHAAAKVSR